MNKYLESKFIRFFVARVAMIKSITSLRDLKHSSTVLRFLSMARSFPAKRRLDLKKIESQSEYPELIEMPVS